MSGFSKVHHQNYHYYYHYTHLVHQNRSIHEVGCPVRSANHVQGEIPVHPPGHPVVHVLGVMGDGWGGKGGRGKYEWQSGKGKREVYKVLARDKTVPWFILPIKTKPTIRLSRNSYWCLFIHLLMLQLNFFKSKHYSIYSPLLFLLVFPHSSYSSASFCIL